MASSQSIQTFVFMDFATVPGTSKVTKVHLRAVSRIGISHLDIRESTDDLSLNFWRNGFNFDSYREINKFINRQKKPVCLVAHNGKRFDFPILKRELQTLNVTLSDDVLCADSLYAFYDILEHPDEYEGRAVRDIFYEGSDKPDDPFTLGEVYNRVVQIPKLVPHPAEIDTLMLFRISCKLDTRFLAWTDQIPRKFADVKPEELNEEFTHK